MVPKEPTFEFTFSYWIFAWFLIYYYGFTKYNPKIWLMIALIINIVSYLIGFKKNKNSYLLTILYTIINFCIKIIPIYLLRNTVSNLKDFIAGIVLLILFFLWLFFRMGSIKDIIQYFENLFEKEKKNKPSTPLISFIFKLFHI